MDIVAFLQNPYSKVYAGGTWPRESWLRAFRLARSGKRLTKIFPRNEFEIWWDNTTAVVAPDPHIIIPPDELHITKVIFEQEPKLILAFGKQAGVSLRKLYDEDDAPMYNIPLIIMPHPTYRVVTDQLFINAARAAYIELAMLEPVGKVIYEYKQMKEGIFFNTTTFENKNVRRSPDTKQLND